MYVHMNSVATLRVWVRKKNITGFLFCVCVYAEGGGGGRDDGTAATLHELCFFLFCFFFGRVVGLVWSGWKVDSRRLERYVVLVQLNLPNWGSSSGNGLDGQLIGEDACLVDTVSGRILPAPRRPFPLKQG